MTSKGDVVTVLGGGRPLSERWAECATQAQARALALDLGLTQKAAVAALKLRDQRRERRTANRDPLAVRNPACERWRRQQVYAALRQADFRVATHDHHTVVSFGEPGATSESGKARPSDVGLPNAYAKRGFFVTVSVHQFAFAANWLTAVKLRGATFVGDALVLGLATEPDEHGGYEAVVVRQGRGTSLVCERVTLVQTEQGWARQRKSCRRAA